MAQELKFPVAELLKKPQGTREEYEINLKPNFGEDITFKSNLKAKVILMALKDEIHVELRDLETEIERHCDKCLKKYGEKVHIPLVEGEYLTEPPKYTEKDEDFFLIDKKDLNIDITDLLRQEILLHFPLISVCSKSCKGLCPKCGTDLNKRKCDCKTSDDGKKPLAVLKYFK
ncbi:MAG: DUF177 domain-containing protein [Patescibacteria group bacterium]